MQVLSFTPPALKTQLIFGSVAISALLWELLLFGQAAGPGLLVFTMVALGLRLYSKKVIHLTDLLPLLTALSACFTNTGLHWWIWVASWAIVLGRDQLKAGLPVQYPLMAGLLRASIAGLEAFSLVKNRPQSKAATSNSAWLKAAILPAIVTAIFLAIYLAASPAFLEKWNSLTSGILWMFESWNPMAIGSMLLGAGFGVWLMIAPQHWPESWRFSEATTQMVRARAVQSTWNIGLRAEFRMGYLLLLSVNVLLALYHMADIPWVWFSYDPGQSSAVMSQLVHEGTYLLIASILLSMGIMLWIFRANLNFFSKVRSLRVLSYLWIVQNGFLVLSVAIRNYHYIAFDGLTYKRIGVIVFLGMCLIGLATLAFKIARQKSLSDLFGKNLAFALFLAVGLSAMPWARWITRYNIDHYHQTGRFDWIYMSTLDETNLDLLWDFSKTTPEDLRHDLLSNKIAQYQESHKDQDWRSWSWTRSTAEREISRCAAEVTAMEFTTSPEEDFTPQVVSE